MIPNLHLVDAGLAYRNKAVFAHINLHIPAEKRLALLGPSGVGKTSFLRMLAGLTINDESVTGEIRTSNYLPLKDQIAYMAQQDLLVPWMTTYQNAILELKLRKHPQQENMRKIDLANKLLAQAGLYDAKKLYPHQLSGGMRQRVALVRTLIQEKPIVLMDEPFSALDAITRYQLQQLASDMLQHKTVVFITHDPAEALRLADKVYLMHGSPANIKLIAEPKTPTPRDMHNEESMKLNADIFSQLTQMEVHA